MNIYLLEKDGLFLSQSKGGFEFKNLGRDTYIYRNANKAELEMDSKELNGNIYPISQKEILQMQNDLKKELIGM